MMAWQKVMANLSLPAGKQAIWYLYSLALWQLCSSRPHKLSFLTMRLRTLWETYTKNYQCIWWHKLQIGSVAIMLQTKTSACPLCSFRMQQSSVISKNQPGRLSWFAGWIHRYQNASSTKPEVKNEMQVYRPPLHKIAETLPNFITYPAIPGRWPTIRGQVHEQITFTILIKTLDPSEVISVHF